MQEYLGLLTFWRSFYQHHGLPMPKTPPQPVFLRFRRSQLVSGSGGWSGTLQVACDIYYSIQARLRRVDQVLLAVNIPADCASEYRLTYEHLGGQALGHMRGDIVVTVMIEEDRERPEGASEKEPTTGAGGQEAHSESKSEHDSSMSAAADQQEHKQMEGRPSAAT